MNSGRNIAKSNKMLVKPSPLCYNIVAKTQKCRRGGIGRHKGLKIPRLRLYGFKSRLRYHCTLTELLLLGYVNIRSSKATSMVVGKFVVVKGEVKLRELLARI